MHYITYEIQTDGGAPGIKHELCSYPAVPPSSYLPLIAIRTRNPLGHRPSDQWLNTRAWLCTGELWNCLVKYINSYIYCICAISSIVVKDGGQKNDILFYSILCWCTVDSCSRSDFLPANSTNSLTFLNKFKEWRGSKMKHDIHLCIQVMCQSSPWNKNE